MITVGFVNHMWRSSFVCDRCWEPITNVSFAAAVYVQTGDDPPQVEHRHKGACFPHEERRPWAELRGHLRHLATSVGLEELPPD